MERMGSDGDEVTMRLSREELRLIGAALQEALDGAYRIPEDVWEELVGASREDARAAVDEIVAALAR